MRGCLRASPTLMVAEKPRNSELFFDPITAEGGVMPYREVFVPVDNSPHLTSALDRAIEIRRPSAGHTPGNHCYRARLHDVRFRQLEPGLPAQFHTAEHIKKKRKIQDQL